MVKVLETHTDAKSGEVVVELEGEWQSPLSEQQGQPVKLPAACASCGGEATRTVRSQGEGRVHGLTGGARRRIELPVPYCDTCFRRDKAEGRRFALLVLLVAIPVSILAWWWTFRLEGWWQAGPGILGVLGVGAVIAASGVFVNPLRDGSAVRIVVDGTSGPIRLHFKNHEYAEAFVEANRTASPGGMPWAQP